MIESLKKLLNLGTGAEKSTPPDLRVATCALLLEAAESDNDVPPEERAIIVSQLRDHFALGEKEVENLIAETEAERASSSDMWPFTNAIGKAFTPDLKLDLLVMVWRVIFADGRLDPYEDQWVHRLERMLSVNHSVLMEAKRLAREPGGPHPDSK